MPAPSLYVNTTLVKWTPTGGTLVTLNRITQAGLAWNYEVINNRADLDVYDSSAHVVGAKPTLSLAGNNAMFYMTLVQGIGLITWTTVNADAPAGGTGSITWSMNPAMNPLGDYSGPHGQYASGNLTMMGLAIDGITNPVSFTVVSSGSFVGAMALPPPGEMARMAPPGRVGRTFALPAPPEEKPAEGAPVDAVILPLARFAKGSGGWKTVCRIQVEGARALGLDPDAVTVRPQGLDRIVTPKATVGEFSLMHAHDSDLGGEHRYRWVDRGDGVMLGYLTDEAREADQDAA